MIATACTLLIVAICAVAPSAAAAALPDGRAYEQATPVEKNGLDIQGKPTFVEASPNGSAIVYPMKAPLPGAEGGQEFPSLFLSRRGMEGWTTTGLQPSASLASAAQVRGWTEDLSEAFVVAAAAEGGPYTAYMRDTGNGVLTPMGQMGASWPYYAGASDGGGVVAFETKEVLAPGAVKRKPNLYVWDRETGELSAAGVLNTGGAASAGGSFAGPYDWWDSNTAKGGAEARYFTQASHALADTGARMYFTAGGSGTLYVRENPTEPQSTYTGEEECTESTLACTHEVSRPNADAPVDPNGEQPAIFATATPDGSTAFLMSAGKLTADATTGPSDEGEDLYRYEAEAPPGERLTDLTPDTEAGDAAGAEVRGVLGVSEDGSYVYFVANGVLASGASRGDCTPLGGGKIMEMTGKCNLYVWHDGVVTWIAELDPEPELTTAGGERKSDGMDWLPTSNLGTTGGQPTARVTPAGTTLVFASQRKLTGYESEGQVEFYRYAYGEQGVTCLTCDPGGTAPAGGASLENNTYENGGYIAAPLITRNLSADGDRLFFQSPDALVAADVDGGSGCQLQLQKTGALSCQDVYEWEASGSGTCTALAADYMPESGGCIYLISSGTSSSASFFADAGDEGEDVFFYTTSQLVSQDRDQLVDIYDAKVGGGLASQNRQEAVPCVGESCHGPGQTTPATESAGTVGHVGEANAKPTRQCSVVGHRVKKFSSRAAQLRRAARHASDRHRARLLRHRARRFAKRAKQAGRAAKSCRRSNRGAGR